MTPLTIIKTVQKYRFVRDIVTNMADMAILLMHFLGYFGSKNCSNEINWLKKRISQIFWKVLKMQL